MHWTHLASLLLGNLLKKKRIVPTTDASFQEARYAVLIEDNPNKKYTSTGKT